MRLTDEREAFAIAQTHGIAEPIARILAGRGVSVDDAPDYLAPSLKTSLPDPSHLLDMDKAVARTVDAILAGKRITVFGDYDVDGATSAALLMRYMREIGADMLAYIPDRMKEGYGPNITAFDTLIEKGTSLIITVDCGTLAYAPIAHAKARGVDVIVLDHHTAEATLPEAYAVVNPNRLDETSMHRNLAAVGVTFLFLVGLNRRLRECNFFCHSSQAKRELESSAVEVMDSCVRRNDKTITEPNLMTLLDIVALGTVADVVTLKGLNRVLVAQGLKVMAARGNVGLRALADVARMDETPSTYHLGHLLGPRINAGGRVGQSDLGLKLLIEEDEGVAAEMAAQLNLYNAERQAIEASVLEQAMAMADAQANMPVILLSREGWHQGVIGIVAGRIKERFGRPCAVVALDSGMGKASARSVAGADFGAAVHQAHALHLIEQGGGHAMAAGFSVRAEKIEALHHFFCERMASAVSDYQAGRVLKLDGWISASGATLELLELIDRAGPYGAGNARPTFGLRDVQVVKRTVMKEKHLRLILADAGGKGRLTAVAFNVADTPLGQALATRHRLHVAGELKRNLWQGEQSVQLIIEDVAWD